MPVASERAGLGNRTLRGMFWAYGSYVGGRLLVLLTVAILARVLEPSEFGLVAIALLVTTLLDTVADLGVSEALIVVDDDEVHEKAHTAWTLGMIGAGVLTLATAALGPLAAAFFDEPALTVMLPVLGANFVLRALGITHFALAQKQLDFRTRTIAEASDVLVRGVVGIGLALWGAGAYSLVGGYLAGTIAMTISLWALVPWRPSPRLHRADLSGLLRFGGGLTAIDVISAIVTNVDYLIIGRVLGTTDLGLYTLGWRLPELVIVNFAVVAGLVLFPAFAEIERRALAGAYLTALRYTLIVCLPFAVGLALLAEPMVLIAFGDRWIGSIEVMQVLTIYAFSLALAIPGGVACKAIGRVDILVKLAIPQAAVAITSIALLADRGIVAVAACQAAVFALFSLIQVGLAARLLGVGGPALLRAARSALLAGVALTAVVIGLEQIIGDPYLTLGVAIPTGGAAYLGVLWAIDPEALRRLWRTLQARGVARPA